MFKTFVLCFVAVNFVGIANDPNYATVTGGAYILSGAIFGFITSVLVAD